MIDQIGVSNVRVGHCVAVPDVVYISGASDAVAQGLERATQILGQVQILAESMVDGEKSVQIRWCPAIRID